MRALHRIVRTLGDTAGASLVEAAVITPLLLLLTFSVADFATMFYVYLALENGVSQATRFGVTGATLADPSSPGGELSHQDSIKAAMRAATPTLTLDDSAFTFQHMSPGGGTWAAGDGGPDDIEKVTVDYNWSLMTPLLRPFFPDGQLHMTVASAMKNEARFK